MLPFNLMVWVIGLLFTCGLLFFGAVATNQDFNAALLKYRSHALIRSNAMQAFATATLRQSELSLEGIANDLRQLKSVDRARPAMQAILHNSARFDPVSDYLFVFQDHELWLADGSDPVETGTTAPKSQLLSYLTQRRAEAPAIGSLIKAGSAQWLPFIKTVTLDDGQTLLLGVLIPTRLFGRIDTSFINVKGDFDAITNVDGEVLWQRGTLNQGRIALQAASTRPQWRHGSLSEHGPEALIAFQRSTNFPLITVSGYRESEYLAEWRQRRNSSLLFSLVSALLALATTAWVALRIKTVSDSERYYHQLFDSVAEGLLLVRGAAVVAANPRAAALFGVPSPAELIGLPAPSLSPPRQPDGSDSQQHLERLRELARAGSTPSFTWRHRRLDNNAPLDCEVQLSLITLNNTRYTLASLRDISQRLGMERALLESRQQLMEVQRIAGIGVWSMSLESQACEWSEEVFHILGLDRDKDTPGCELFEACVYPPDRILFNPAYRHMAAGDHMTLEFRVLRPNGELREIAIEAEYITGGGASGMSGPRLAGAIFDITERKRTERRLVDSERQYRQLVELMPEAVLIHHRGQIQYANPTAGALFKERAPGDLIARSVFEIISPDYRDAVIDKLARIASGADYPKTFERRLLQRLDGETFHAEVAAEPLFFNGVECVQVVIRDIDARERVQQALALSNTRLQALSAQMIEMLENDRRQLARELHDDVGQLLTFIKMGCGRLQERLAASDYGARLATLHACAGEALDKVRDLSRMLRPAQLDAQGLTAAIRWQLEHYLQGGAIRCEADLPELQPRPDGTIEITLFRIFQEALTNIIRHSGASQISVTLERGEGRIGLHIVDDGVGFDVEAKQKQGTGLGLASMSERAKLAGGQLHVHSVPGVGTELTLTLPDLETLSLQLQLDKRADD